MTNKYVLRIALVSVLLASIILGIPLMTTNILSQKVK